MKKTYEEILAKYSYIGCRIVKFSKDEILENYCFKEMIKDEKEMTDDAIFRIASVSKIEVALAALKLYEEGRLDLDEDISKYLGFLLRNPNFPDDVITVRELMTQTSSLNDGGDEGYDLANEGSVDIKLSSMFLDEKFPYYSKKTFLNVKPGTVWNYSNFGCGILACIVEKISGMYFTDYVRKVLLEPLELDASFRVDDIKKQDEIASLYYFNPKTKEYSLQRNKELFHKYLFPKYELGNNFRGPAGGLFISALDLAKIGQFLMNDGAYKGVQIYKKETIQEMKRVQWEGTCDDPVYKKKGLQLLILDDFCDKRLVGHFGYAYGLRSFLLVSDTTGYICIFNGADYHEKHGMTDLQEEILKAMVKE